MDRYQQIREILLGPRGVHHTLVKPVQPDPIHNLFSESVCPFCLKQADLSVIESESLVPGKPTVCPTCTEVVIVGEEFKLSKPTFNDWISISKDSALEESLEKIKKLVKKT